jgi:prepilin-type N-terminal cleavage/methylation domain-containing protein
MLANRKGFSLLEMLVVFALIAILTAIALPKFHQYRDGANLRSARDQVHSYVTMARAAAVRRGVPSEFRASGNSIWITVANATTGVQEPFAPAVPLDELRGATLSVTTNAETIRFDGRGMANLGTSGVLRVTRGPRSDSVCVTPLGMVMRGGCL